MSLPVGLGVPKKCLERLEGGFGVFACGVGVPKRHLERLEGGFGVFACGVGGAKKEFGAFGVFEAWQTARLNGKKKLLMWPAGLGVPKRHFERLEGGFGVFACGVGMPLLPCEATKEPSSTPPVVPGAAAAPALAKAGAGGYYIDKLDYILYLIFYILYTYCIYIILYFIYGIYIYILYDIL